jgi:hypothetical protein
MQSYYGDCKILNMNAHTKPKIDANLKLMADNEN